MKRFTLDIDEKADALLDQLKVTFGKTSRAEVLRLAIALLKIAGEAHAQGYRLTVANRDNKVEREILIAG